jgi:bacillithiol biosynthesis cysteine-adding enzyme BshC
MHSDSLPYDQTGYFSSLICDYLDNHESLHPFFGRYPEIANFEGQIQEKAANFPNEHREILYGALINQYKGFEMGKKTRTNLIMLKEPMTFTVVTGHQLNLFTGPLYFLFKIISTINLTVLLKKRYPKYNFVPIYWMATEDHDFEEINYFNFGGRKLQWNRDADTSPGAVGQLSTKGLDEVYTAFSNAMGKSKNAEALKSLFKQAYLEHENLTDATRFLANTLFGEYGLVILDGDDYDLKRLLVPYIKKDLFEQVGYKNVSQTIEGLQELPGKYDIQVNPREINYFYLKEGLRERIVEVDGRYSVLQTTISWNKEQLLKELNDFPERFSPNVISRPLYQEVILPNLCYIGGGGELAYWLELKTFFEAMKVTFPILLLRNSVLVMTKKQSDKLTKLKLSLSDIFLRQGRLINKKIREISNIDIDFSPQKKYLDEQFKALYEVAEHTDKSFLGAVKAQEVKQKKGLDHLEKRLLKAQKRKLEDHIERMTELQNTLFPGRSLQERNLNFSELYLEWGEELVPMLFDALDPLHLRFLIIQL